MIIRRIEIFIYLDNAISEELILSNFSKNVISKARKKGSRKKGATRKAIGKKNEGCAKKGSQNKKTGNQMIVKF